MTTGSETISTAPSTDTVLVVGATSSLAQALCHALARKGHGLILAGRDEVETGMLANDIALRHNVACAVITADFLDPHFSAESLIGSAGVFDHAVIAAGFMGDNDPTNLGNIALTSHVNYTLPAQIATLAALRLAEKKSGNLILISSVAGDRGRASNYAYGSAKAALTAFASGLRNAFCKKGVHVMTVKPGFIDTPMTWGMKSPLIASREAVADAIIEAMREKQDVIYTPWFWRYIMLVIMHIPEGAFKRLRL